MCPPAPTIGEDSVTSPVLTPLAGIAIRSIQPDREHAVLEVVGAPGLASVDDLQQRLEGLMVAGVRYLLVDLAEAVPGDAVVSLLADTAPRLEARQGWLRVNHQCSSPPVGLAEATLDDLFAIYRAFARTADPWGGAHMPEHDRPCASAVIRPGGSS